VDRKAASEKVVKAIQNKLATENKQTWMQRKGGEGSLPQKAWSSFSFTSKDVRSFLWSWQDRKRSQAFECHVR
jgi:hypothetical protein